MEKGKSKKRKRETLDNNVTALNQSFSQLSISRRCSKKVNNVPAESNEAPLPHYLSVPDRVFKQLLARAFDEDDTLARWLNTEDKLASTRRLAHLLHLSRCLQLQQRMWQPYFELGQREGVWAPRKSKAIAKKQNTCSTYGRSEALAKQRQKTIEHQIRQTMNELQQHKDQLPQWTDQAQPPIRSTALFQALETLVENGQRRLTAEFAHKQLMLQLDADDHRLIAVVDTFKATVEKIDLVNQYWQRISDRLKAIEEVAIFRQRVSLRRPSRSFDDLVDQSIDDLRTRLSHSLLDKDQRAILVSRCSKTITQYKFDLMTLTIATAEETARANTQLATEAKNRLLLLDGDQPEPDTLLLIQAIEVRGENMEKRAAQLLQYKLTSFFELAPTVVNDDGSVPVGAK